MNQIEDQMREAIYKNDTDAFKLIKNKINGSVSFMSLRTTITKNNFYIFNYLLNNNFIKLPYILPLYKLAIKFERKNILLLFLEYDKWDITSNHNNFIRSLAHENQTTNSFCKLTNLAWNTKPEIKQTLKKDDAILFRELNKINVGVNILNF